MENINDVRGRLPMKVQPREQLLDIWRATARASFQDGEWLMGGRDGSNSISDAEQLLCIMHPATELPSFQLDAPDETADDILGALKGMGDALDIPQLLIKVLVRYMERYTDGSGSPIFSGDGYFSIPESGSPLSPDQKNLGVVDSFGISIPLTLTALAFIRNFRREVRREDLRQEMDKLEELSNIRLTAAMVGLLRSFSLHVFDVQSVPGLILLGRSNQGGLPERQILADLRLALRQVRSSLRDLTIGSGQAVADLDSSSRLFECGWSWGIVKDTAPIDMTEIGVREKFVQPAGVAVDNPYLYFTGVALAGIEDLTSDRTRFLGLLNDGQRRLADALRIRLDLTQSYWSTIATFGTGRWPLEDLPWRTSDGQESDYYSLQVAAMVVQNQVRRRASDSELSRVGRILADLANRGRINRRPLLDDFALAIHAPGLRLGLRGSEMVGDHPIGWLVSNFAPLLLKRTFAIAGFLRDTDLRGNLLTLADSVWEHLLQRRLKDGSGRDLWDQPGDVFDQLKIQHDQPSWYHTERVVECLVEAANVINRAPAYSTRLSEIATDLLYEAEHLFDRELLTGSGEGGLRGVLQAIRAKLRRAREIVEDRPGSAAVLANEVLRELEGLVVSRQDVAGGA
ncbi:MAG: SCO2524 family protein [bacterium]